MRRAEAAHVERPQVHARIAVDDPVGHHPARAARRRDARREAAAQVEVVELGREADDRLAVGGDRDRAVDHLPDADFVQHRDARAPRLRRAARSARSPAAAARDRSPARCRWRPTAACSSPSRRPPARRARASRRSCRRDRAATAGRPESRADFSVTKYWCSTAHAGTRVPTIAAISRPHMPAALITHSVVDVALVGDHRRHAPAALGERRHAQPWISATPPARAPAAYALVRLVGST